MARDAGGRRHAEPGGTEGRKREGVSRRAGNAFREGNTRVDRCASRPCSPALRPKNPAAGSGITVADGLDSMG